MRRSVKAGKMGENESGDLPGREKSMAGRERGLGEAAYIFGMAEDAASASSSSSSESRPRSLAIPL